MSAEVIKKTTIGNQKVHTISMVGTADKTLNVDTGLDVIDYMLVSPNSATTSFYTAKQNELSVGTATNGWVSVTGTTNGDGFHIMAFGR